MEDTGLQRIKHMTKQVWFWPLVAVVAVAVGLLGVGNARYGLFDVDEAIFTQASREMLHSDRLRYDRQTLLCQAANKQLLDFRSSCTSYVHCGAVLSTAYFRCGLASLTTIPSMPTYNGEPRYHKPPLVYWAQGALMEALGETSLWAARGPSLVSALLTVLLLGVFTARVWGWRPGLTAAGMLVTSLSFLVVGRAATADGLLNLFSLATVLAGLAQVYKVPGTRGHWALTGVLAGLGLLAKGPIAWLPSLLVLGVLFAVRWRERRKIWKAVKPLRVAGVATLVLVPWLALMAVQGGWGFFYEFLWVQNIQRYGAGFHNTQSSSRLYYLLVLMLGFLPWVLLLPRSIRWQLKGWRARVASTDVAEALPALALVWAVGYILFFSLSATKLAHYIVPAYPALVLVIVGYWHHQGHGAGAVMRWPGAVWLGLVGLLLVNVNGILEVLSQPVLSGWLAMVQVWTGFSWPPGDPMAWAALTQDVVRDAATTFAGWVVLLAVVPAWVLVAKGRRDVLPALGFAWAMALGLVIWGTVPTVWRTTQGALALLAEDIRAMPQNVAVVHLGLHKPSVLYFSQRPFTKLEKPVQLPLYLDNTDADEVAVLTEWPTVAGIEETLQSEPNWREGDVWCKGGFCIVKIGRKLGA